MTGRRSHIILIFSVLALLLSSCSRQKPAYYRENMCGTWILDVRDGEKLDERDFLVMSFSQKLKHECSGVMTLPEGNYQWGTNSLLYDIYCCDFSIYGDYTGLFGFETTVTTRQEYDFVSAEDSLVTLRLRSCEINGSAVEPDFSTLTLRKIPITGTKVDSLLGIWQFKTMDDQIFDRHRLQFSGDGSLKFYSRKEGNDWALISQEDHYYRYSDLLVLNLSDNPVFGTPGKSDVRNFLIENLSPSAGSMILSSGGRTYTLSYVSSE